MLGMLGSNAATAEGDIVDFSNWSVVQDPPNTQFTASATPTQATLRAGNGAVPLGTDIGYQSVNGATPAVSTQGYAFSHLADFAVAIDFDLSFTGSPIGALSLGFGIGEDADGRNSAGVGMGTFGGGAVSNFLGAARVNDQDQDVLDLGLASTLSGSLFVSYDAASGDVTVGAAPTMGAAAPTASGTYAGIQNQWTDGDLQLAFFLRSGPLFAWSGGGQGQAVFSNLRVLDGAPFAVPEPHAGGILLLLAGFVASRRRLARPEHQRRASCGRDGQ
jgi:hypothetical protein